MKKEVVVASAIIALLSSLSAESNIRVNEIKPGVDGKIIAPKDIIGKIDKNKEIGKEGQDKFNIYCPNNGCVGKPKGDQDLKKPHMGKRPILDKKPNIGKTPKNIGQRP